MGVVVFVVYQLPSLMKIYLCDSDRNVFNKVKFYLSYVFPRLPTFLPTQTHEYNTETLNKSSDFFRFEQCWKLLGTHICKKTQLNKILILIYYQ